MYVLQSAPPKQQVGVVYRNFLFVFRPPFETGKVLVGRAVFDFNLALVAVVVNVRVIGSVGDEGLL